MKTTYATLRKHALARLKAAPSLPADIAKLLSRGDAPTAEQEQRASAAIEAITKELRESRPESLGRVEHEIREFVVVSSKFGLQSVRVA